MAEFSSNEKIIGDHPIKTWSSQNKALVNLLISLTVFVICSAYFCWATYYYISKHDGWFEPTTCDGYGFLVIIYLIYVFGMVHTYALKEFVYPSIKENIYLPLRKIISDIKYLEYITYGIILAAIIAYLIYDTWENRNRLIPVVGFLAFILFGYITSSNRSKIKWRPVLSGMILQFLFGLLTIRWSVGRNIFDCIGQKVTIFLNYAVDGAAFVYGDFLVIEKSVFAFRALAAIFFLGFCINILYHYGIMQKIVSTMGEFLQWIMGTSVCESVNSAANIFLGLSEAPLLLKPYLKDLTKSELHSVMTSGFATVSGTVFAAYISFGASATNLITSSVMSAPAALCYSKLNYPETEEITLTTETITEVESEYESVLDAASKGAADAFYLVSGIIASVIAFIAAINFLNGTLSWFGILVGYTNPDELWTFTLIIGKIFIPISYIMGVPWEDCEKVGQLIGLKTIINEFAAFEQMSALNLTGRTKTIATFAICGFANPGSIGITISTIGTLIPSRRETVTQLVFRAFVGGAIVCFMTACVAGALTPDELV